MMKPKVLFALFLMLFTSHIICAQNPIGGVITDHKGKPLSSVRIEVKNAPQIYTLSDIDGVFRLDVPDKDNRLTFTLKGYKTIEKTASDDLLNIKMIPSVPMKKFYVGVGFKIGVFYPTEVNDYITDYFGDNVYETTGSFDIFVNWSIYGSLTYRLNKRLDLLLIAEATIAPKFIFVSNTGSGMDDDFYYRLNRSTIGPMVNFHIPIRSKFSMYFGGGFLFHSISFKGLDDYHGNTIGGRLQAGFSLNLRKINPQLVLGFDLAKADGTDDNENHLDLNYSGIFFGFNFNF